MIVTKIEDLPNSLLPSKDTLDMETNQYSHLHDWGSSEVGECGRLDADTMVLLVDLEILLLDEVAAVSQLVADAELHHRLLVLLGAGAELLLRRGGQRLPANLLPDEGLDICADVRHPDGVRCDYATFVLDIFLQLY